MIDEVLFNFHGTVNKQGQLQILTNFTIALFVTQKLLFGVLFGPEELFDPCFFEDEDGRAITVTSQPYTEMIDEFLSPRLPPDHNLWFQQFGATADTAVMSMAALCRLFPLRVISRFGDVPWPPRSPDLTASDFFFLCSRIF